MKGKYTFFKYYLRFYVLMLCFSGFRPCVLVPVLQFPCIFSATRIYMKTDYVFLFYVLLTVHLDTSVL